MPARFEIRIPKSETNMPKIRIPNVETRSKHFKNYKSRTVLSLAFADKGAKDIHKLPCLG